MPKGVVLYALIALAGVGLVLLLWQMFGLGPRLRRALGRGQRLLHLGNWSEALSLAQGQLAQTGLPEVWQARFRQVAGECHQMAGDQALKDKSYEQALDQYLQAAPLLGTNPADLRERVIGTMLGEARQLFSAGPGENAALLSLLQRTFGLQSPCPEASFWLGLGLIRQGQLDGALAALTTAHEQAGKLYLDPALYLGMVLHRLGRPQEALRFLGEANRVDTTCPFVTWQMGISLIAANGDSGMALRALQRAMGPRGLPLWAATPERAWIEAFPETKSLIRRLAARYPYVCPLLGKDLSLVLRQGNQALAEAHYRQGHFQEAADLFGKLLQDSAPTLLLLRGLGLSLARLQRYDQAYKHLRAAVEMEGGKEPLTAAYLALCGAMGKPTQPEDKARNVAWAIRLLARYSVMGNAELAGLNNAVFAEARSLAMPLGLEDQLHLCNILASVQAVDPQAAAAYGHLVGTFPDAVLPIHAWLYCRAATVHGVRCERDLDLFAHTFRERGTPAAFYARQQWNTDDIEYTYLQRSGAAAPGHFPEVLGPDYPPRGEAFLLERSQREEQADNKEAALACMEVLLQLAPTSLAGHDRLACLHYRQGDLDRAVSWLEGWQKYAPRDHWPLVRQAIIEQQRGNAEARAQVIQRALDLTGGRLRGAIAYLGAQLALRSGVRGQGSGVRKDEHSSSLTPDPCPLTPELARVTLLLQECLRFDPDHVEALWCLAAVRTVLGDQQGLAELAAFMNRPAVSDARFHYLGAVCFLAAKNYAQALELGQRAAADEALAAESHYLMAWAHLHLDNQTAAAQALQKVAGSDQTPTAVYARAMLGKLSFAREAYDDAIRWWNAVDARKRAAWHLEEPLRQTVLLSGLLALSRGRYEPAADRFREAGKLGLRDKRLGGLLTLALVKAGQQLLYDHAQENTTV